MTDIEVLYAHIHESDKVGTLLGVNCQSESDRYVLKSGKLVLNLCVKVTKLAE